MGSLGNCCGFGWGIDVDNGNEGGVKLTARSDALEAGFVYRGKRGYCESEH